MQAHPTQLSLFDEITRATVARYPARPLVLMACSATKLNLPAPAMGLTNDANQTRRHVGKKSGDPVALELLPQHGLTMLVNTMHLKYSFRTR